MDFEPFRTMCDSLPTQAKNCANGFCDSLPEVFPDDAFMIPNRVYALFCGNGLVVGRSHFYRRRKLILYLYDWLLEQDLVNPAFVAWVSSLTRDKVVAAREIENLYYKDLDDVLGYISWIGSLTNLGGYGDLLSLKSIVILSWYGVERIEMTEIKKTDLDVGHSAVLIHGEHEREIVMPGKYLDVLRYYATEDFHRGFPSGKKQVYRPSPFLFRTERLEKVTPENILGLISRFNDEAKRYGRVIRFPQLRRNSVFASVLERDDGKKSVNVLIMEVSGCDKFLASELSHVYEQWKARYVDTHLV